MSHYPMMAWNRHHDGSIMLHGHCHGSMTYPFTGRILDVGVDVHKLAPISIDYILQNMENIKPHVIDLHVLRKSDVIQTQS